MPSDLIRPLRDDRTNAMLPKPAADGPIAVAFITGKMVRACASANPDRIHQGLELFGFVSLSGGDMGGQGQTSAVR